MTVGFLFFKLGVNFKIHKTQCQMFADLMMWNQCIDAWFQMTSPDVTFGQWDHACLPLSVGEDVTIELEAVSGN